MDTRLLDGHVVGAGQSPNTVIQRYIGLAIQLDASNPLQEDYVSATTAYYSQALVSRLPSQADQAGNRQTVFVSWINDKILQEQSRARTMWTVGVGFDDEEDCNLGEMMVSRITAVMRKDMVEGCVVDAVKAGKRKSLHRLSAWLRCLQVMHSGG